MCCKPLTLQYIISKHSGENWSLSTKTYPENGTDELKIQVFFFSEFQMLWPFSRYIKMSSLIHRIFTEYLYSPK